MLKKMEVIERALKKNFQPGDTFDLNDLYKILFDSGKRYNIGNRQSLANYLRMRKDVTCIGIVRDYGRTQNGETRAIYCYDPALKEKKLVKDVEGRSSHKSNPDLL
jgi:hypothetical protein